MSIIMRVGGFLITKIAVKRKILKQTSSVVPLGCQSD